MADTGVRMSDPSPTACLDLDLLRRAYGDFLAVPGLATVGGWRCYRADGPEPIAEWIKGAPGELAPTRFRLYNGRDWCRRDEYHMGWEPEDPRHACDDGDLLPLVDPSDPGSWAILLRDLAVAAGLNVTGATGFAWERRDSPYRDLVVRPAWRLVLCGAYGIFGHHLCGDDVLVDGQSVVSVRDPALALVLDRISIREQTGR